MTAPQSIVLQAGSLPTPLAGLRAATSSGAVLATFERSAYLDLDGRIVALASADLARGPLSISLRESGPLPTVSTGAVVRLAGGELRVGAITVDLHTASAWDPLLPPAPLPDDATAVSRQAVIDEVLASAPDGSIVPLLVSEPHRAQLAASPPIMSAAPPGGPLLGALSRGLASLEELLAGQAEPARILPAIAGEIAGRGPGLTPSGDDLLVGICYALTVWPRLVAGDARTVRELLVGAARPRTTRISAAYLDAARDGLAAEPWHVLIRSLGGPAAETRAAVRRLLLVGETSGADALTGFCWAWRRLPA